MSKCSWLCRVARQVSASSAPRWVLLVVGGPLASCVPERALSSYRTGSASSPASAGSTRSDRSDAGAVATFGLPTDTGGPSAAAATLDAGLVDRAPIQPLACSPACACERRDGRDYMFCAEAVEYGEAVERCAAAGGALVSVEDEEQNLWLVERMLAATSVDDFWLSGTDVEDEGVWVWQDGRVFFDLNADAAAAAPFVPWGDEQPNDLNGEDCMRSTAGVWRDLDCSELLPYACQG